MAHYIVANRSGMLALGLECVKAAAQPENASESKRPFEAERLAYLAGGDGDGICGLLVNSRLSYQAAAPARPDEPFDWSVALANMFLWGALGFATIGVLTVLHWLLTAF
ncbi:MAG: hypothetical protein AAF184_11785 [Pseudomonadota bacterium]